MPLSYPRELVIIAITFFCFSCAAVRDVVWNEPHPLTVLALGDTEEQGGLLRACGSYANDMYTGRHDGGLFDVMIFLGDNFSSTGLNVPSDGVESTAKSVLGRFNEAIRGLGSSNVYGIPGEHDYYARNMVEASYLFGLISVEENPTGLTDKGNHREAALGGWTYYYKMPAQATYSIEAGSRDSVQFIFFDSALLLRTPASSWHPALDSLRQILLASGKERGIVWRVLCVHHPLYSVGEHGGYSEWNDEIHQVDYLTSCDKDTNSYGWFKNWMDPEDLCTDKYRAYVDSLKAVIHSARAPIQVALSAHDHSLQILKRDTTIPELPSVYVISGAASDPTRVKFPSPPRDYTSAQTDPRKEGESFGGFVQLQFQEERLRIRFLNAKNGNWLEMGEGKKEFWMNIDGTLSN